MIPILNDPDPFLYFQYQAIYFFSNCPHFVNKLIRKIKKLMICEINHYILVLTRSLIYAINK